MDLDQVDPGLLLRLDVAFVVGAIEHLDAFRFPPGSQRPRCSQRTRLFIGRRNLRGHGTAERKPNTYRNQNKRQKKVHYGTVVATHTAPVGAQRRKYQ